MQLRATIDLNFRRNIKHSKQFEQNYVFLFRAIGTDFDVDNFSRGSNLAPDRVWRKGEPKTEHRINKTSGFQMVASEAEMDDVSQQVADAIKFLCLHHDELAKLQNFDGAEKCFLDFGIEDRSDVLQCDYFSPELLRLAGNSEVGIEITHY